MIFRTVETKEAVQAVETLAHEIWHQHFTPLIGAEQVSYMLENFQSREAIAGQIESGYSYFIVEEHHTLLGYFAFYQTEEFLYVSKFYLKQEARGKGIAKKMLAYIESEAVKRALPALQLNVYKGNSTTISIYKRVGFEIIDTIQIDIGSGFILDDYVMKKVVHQAERSE